MREYTDLAFAGDAAAATKVRDSLNSVREAFKRTRFSGSLDYFVLLDGLPPSWWRSHVKFVP
jgi:hypothetical protein